MLKMHITIQYEVIFGSLGIFERNIVCSAEPDILHGMNVPYPQAFAKRGQLI
jgi:hypothetical protein